MTAPFLSLTDVSKSYGTKQALRGVSMTVDAGEVVGLLGPNGAGKSTLFQICAGLFAADSGTVALFGQDYRSVPSSILRRIGVVFQSRSLDTDISVKANLRFLGGLFGLWGPELRHRIGAVAETLEITDLLAVPVRELSGGNQRRVEIARALLSQPDLLLLDEPSSGLDPASRYRLVATVRDLARTERKAILWSTHIAEEVEEAARIVLLVDGRVINEAPPPALRQQTGAGSLTDAYIALTGGKPGPAAPPPD
jgi:ABC-2 type transport system ATP-binding protein